MTLSHFSFWGLSMGAAVGLLFVAIGVHILEETRMGIVFIIAGAFSSIGTLFLKKVSVVFDKDTNTAKRCWQAWTGVFKRTKSVPMDRITSIIYEREIAYASVNKSGMKQRFFLFAEVNDGSRFYFFPIGYTPHNAKKKGNEIASFLGVQFRVEETRTESAVRRSRKHDEN